jgi:arsenate reductase
VRILILCTGNSARSQMAEGFLRRLDPRLEVFSAGTEPAPRVNPHAVLAMTEVGVDLSGSVPKSVSRFTDEAFDYVITVCADADASCPAFRGRVGTRLHIGFDDPARATGTEEEVRATFRRVRDEIQERFSELYEREILPRLRA